MGRFDGARAAAPVAVLGVAIIARLDASVDGAVAAHRSDSLHQAKQAKILGAKHPRRRVVAAHSLQPPLALGHVPRLHIGDDVELASLQVQLVCKGDVAGRASERYLPVFALDY